MFTNKTKQNKNLATLFESVKVMKIKETKDKQKLWGHNGWMDVGPQMGSWNQRKTLVENRGPLNESAV